MDTDTDVITNAGLVSVPLTTTNASAIGAIRYTLRRSVVACRNDAVFLYNNRPHLAPQTVRLLANRHSDIHVVLVSVHDTYRL